jgi:hypothetical protein
MSGRVLSAVAGGVGVCLVAGLLTGCTETRQQGVYEAKVVGTETDQAGRISSTLVDVEFVIETSTSDQSCGLVFYDAAGNKLTAPNSTTKEDIYPNSRSYDDIQYQNDPKKKYNRQIKVAGIPRTAKLDC